MGMGRRPGSWPPYRFHEADLEEPEGLSRAVLRAQPDVVLHAAGRTPPGEPLEFYRANTLATVFLLDALRSLRRRVRLVLVGSAAELGLVGVDDLPVGEDYPCRPTEAYGLSKYLATCAGLVMTAPVEVIVARVFNPIGPRTSTHQAFGRFASVLCQSDSKLLTVGDLARGRLH